MHEKALDRLGQDITKGDFFNQDRHIAKTAVLNVLNRIAIGGHLETKDLAALQTLTVCAPPVNVLATVAPPTEKTAVWILPNLEFSNDPDAAEQEIARAFAEAVCSEKDIPEGRISTEINRLLQTWGFPTASNTEQAARAGASA